MRRIAMMLALGLAIGLGTHAQSAEELLKEIEGQYELDDIGNVTYTKVIQADSLKKDELYARALHYFVYRYGSGKAVIQTQDKEAGTIVGKGIYAEVHKGVGMLVTMFDTEHILRIDVKDGRARVIVTLVQYSMETIGTYGSSSRSVMPVGKAAPFTKAMRTQAAKAFVKSHARVQETFKELERALRKGNTGKEGKEDW